MKNAKKLVAILLAMLIALTLIACNKTDQPGTNSPAANNSPAADNSPAAGNSPGAPSSPGSGTGALVPVPPPSEAVGAGVEAAGGSGIPFNSLYRNRVSQLDPVANTPPPGAKIADEMFMLMENFVPSVINPWLPGGAFTSSVYEYIFVYDRLIYPTDKVGTYTPHLATSWETDDYKTFTFHLRDDVYFHNGVNLKASDVVFTFNLAKQEPGSTANTSFWTYVESCRAIDDYTVEMVSTATNVEFYHYAASPAACIACEKAITDDPANGYKIGSGLYKLAEFVPDDYWVVERNDDYWGPLAYTRKQTWKFIPEISTRAIMLMNGDAVYCGRIAVEDMPLFENNEDFVIYDRVLNNPMGFAFNLADPIVADKNFRLAVASALERESIAIALYEGYAAPAYDGTFWGLFSQYRNTDIPPIPEDVEAAKAYLAASSYNGETMELTCVASHQRAIEVIQQQLARIGINTVINVMENAALASYGVWGSNFTQMQWAVNGFGHNASSINSVAYPGGRQNKSEYSNPRVTELLDQGLAESDPAKREAIYREVQELFYEDLPILTIFWSIDTVVARKGFDGITFATDIFTDLRYAYFVEE